MKLKEGFVTHESDGEQIMISAGAVKFSGLVRSNKTAAYIIDSLKSETSKEAIIRDMLAQYDVSKDVVEKDVDMVLDNLRSIGALDE